jgi:hypothetical protein
MRISFVIQPPIDAQVIVRQMIITRLFYEQNNEPHSKMG